MAKQKKKIKPINITETESKKRGVTTIKRLQYINVKGIENAVSREFGIEKDYV